ncbi:MAG: extracellular solute-binding protein [bacterium]
MKSIRALIVALIISMAIFLSYPSLLVATKLEVWLPAYAEMQSEFEKLRADFERRNPDIDVNLNNMDYGAMLWRIAEALKKGEEFDFALAPSDFMFPFVRGERLSPVPETVMSGDEIERAFYPAPLSLSYYRGRCYGLPSTYPTEGVGVIYNRDLWDGAGVSPKGIRNWEDLMRAAQKLTRRDASGEIVQIGFSAREGGNLTPLFLSWILQFGGRILNPKGDRTAFDNVAGEKALETYIDIYRRWRVDDDSISGPHRLFIAGKAASVLGNSAFVKYIENMNPTLRWGIFPRPGVGKSPPHFVNLSSWTRYVPKSSRSKRAAWELVKFLGERERAIYLALLSGEVTPYIDYCRDPRISRSEIFGPIVPVLKYGVNPGYLGDASLWSRAIEGTLDGVLRSDAPVKESLANLRDELDRILAEKDAMR